MYIRNANRYDVQTTELSLIFMNTYLHYNSTNRRSLSILMKMIFLVNLLNYIHVGVP